MQQNKVTDTIKVIALALLLSVGVGYLSAAAPSNPPSCPADWPGCDAPINESATTQTKRGNFFSNGTIFSVTGLFNKLGVNNLDPIAELDVDGDIHATEDICTDMGGGVCLGSIATNGAKAIQFLASPVEYDLNPSSVTTLSLGQEVPEGTGAVLASISVTSDARVYFYTMDDISTGGVGGRTGAGESVASAGGQLILPVDALRRLKYRLTQGDSKLTVLGLVAANTRQPITASCSPVQIGASRNVPVTWTATVNNAPAGTTYSWKGTNVALTSTGSTKQITKSYTTTGSKGMYFYVKSGVINMTVTCSPNVYIGS